MMDPLALAQPLHLQRVGKLEKVAEVGLVHLHLAPVHELQQVGEDLLAGVLEDDDGMALREVLEEAVEVVGAGGQHHPVGGHHLAGAAGQGHVHEAGGVQQLLEGGQRVEGVVVPFEVELLALHD